MTKTIDLALFASSFSAMHYGATALDIARTNFFRCLKISLQKENVAMRFGKKKENDVIDIFLAMGKKISFAQAKTKKFYDIKFSACSDLVENEGSIFEELIEIKNPYFLKIGNERDKGYISLSSYYKKYELQCQLQLYCYNCNRLNFTVYSNSKLFEKIINYDQSVLEKNLPFFQEVWGHLQELAKNLKDENILDIGNLALFFQKEIDKLERQKNFQLENLKKLLKIEKGKFDFSDGSISFGTKNIKLKYN